VQNIFLLLSKNRYKHLIAVFFMTSNNVTEAKGMNVVAQRAHMNPDDMLNALQTNKAPSYRAIYRILNALNINFQELHYST
jgi:DNA-binding phage protein